MRPLYAGVCCALVKENKTFAIVAEWTWAVSVKRLLKQSAPY